MEYDENTKCEGMRDYLTDEAPKPTDDCTINKLLQRYISCRAYYEKNIRSGSDKYGQKERDEKHRDALSNYNFFNDAINKTLNWTLKNVKTKSMAIRCEEDTLYDFQEIVITQDHCYADSFLSAFGSDADVSRASIKLDYFKPVYALTNAHLESKPKPQNKKKLCGTYLACLSSYVHSQYADVSEEVKKLYRKTLKVCSSHYFVITSRVKRKEESRKTRPANSMVSGPRTFITTNIIETTSKQLMYVDPKSGRVILLPLKDKDKSRASLQSYKFDRKACRYDLVSDTQIDKHIRHRQASVQRHNIGLTDDKNAYITFQIKDAGLKERFKINWDELESNGYVSHKGTCKRDTQRSGGISFNSDYVKKQDKVASVVLENIPMGKSGSCQVKAVHDGFSGEGPSQFDLSFEYEIEITNADNADIEIFKSSNVSDQWEYRAIAKKKKKASSFEEEPDGILDIIESEVYSQLSSDDKEKWDKAADSENAEEEFDGMSIDDLEMFTK